MISYSELNNNLQIIKRFIQKNKVIEKSQGLISQQHFQKQYLEQNNPQSFIQIFHYLVIDHSIDFYKQVLSIAPQIKSANDKRFSELAYLIFQKLLKKKPSFTVDQFLSNRFFDAKVIFTAQLTISINKWVTGNNGNGSSNQNLNQKSNRIITSSSGNDAINYRKRKSQKQQNNLKGYIPSAISTNKYQDQDQQEMPIRIQVQPLSLDSNTRDYEKQKYSKKEFSNNYNYIEQSVYEMASNQQNQDLNKNRNVNRNVNKNKNPNVFPKNYTQQQQIENNQKSYSKFLKGLDQHEDIKEIQKQREYYQKTMKSKYNPEKQKNQNFQNIQNMKKKINQPSALTDSYQPTIKVQNGTKYQKQKQKQQYNSKHQSSKQNSLNSSTDKEKDKDDDDKITRQQFNQYLQLVTTMNSTINNLVQKFNTFQSFITTYISNANAKMSMMEENIKVIKGNI